MIRHPQNITV